MYSWRGGGGAGVQLEREGWSWRGRGGCTVREGGVELYSREGGGQLEREGWSWCTVREGGGAGVP